MQPIKRMCQYLIAKCQALREGISQRYWTRKVISGKPVYDNLTCAIMSKCALIRLYGYLNLLCRMLNTDPTATVLYSRIKWMVDGTVPSIEDRIYALDLLDSTIECTPGDKVYAILLSHLTRNSDVNMLTLPLRFNTPEEYQKFMETCGL